MLLSDLVEVNKLIKIKEKLEKAIDTTDTFLTEAQKVDCGGIPGFDTGYNTYLSGYGDGINGVDMSGCYVGVQMAVAAIRVLEEQYRQVISRLQELKVILEEEK